MPFRPLLRSLALPVCAGFLALGLACKGSKHDSAPTDNTTATLSGTVTFDRHVVQRDVNGLPTGIEATPSLTNVPARTVLMVLYRLDSTGAYLTRESATFTGLDGTYHFTINKGQSYMVELQATGSMGGTSASTVVNLFADDATHGMYSSVPVSHRLRYCIRRALDGTTPPTSPTANHVATAAVAGDATVNFHVGDGDSWFLADTDYNRNGNLPLPFIVPGYSPGSSGYQQAGALEASPSGSKPLAILDTFASFSYSQGTSVPALPVTVGQYLDLHYLQGVTQSKGTFVEYDQATYAIVPGTFDSVAYDPYTSSTHYLGCVRGGTAPGTDDAWDQGVLLTLAARGYYHSTLAPRWQFAASNLFGAKPPLPISKALTNLEAEMALLEGLPEAFAAVIQKNPYIGLAATNIADVSALSASDKTIYSAPMIRALAWKVALQAQGISAYPGTPTDWANLSLPNIAAFFVLSPPSDFTDSPNFYRQMSALATATGSPGGLNPSTVFTEANIQALLASAPLSVPVNNIPWPRPTGGPLASLVQDWGTHPAGTLPSAVLSMANAVQVNGAYPNASQGELQFARFLQFGPKRYAMTVTTSPASLSGGQIEVSFISPSSPIGMTVQTFLFSGSSTGSTTLTLEGPAGTDNTQLVRLRMLSPSAVQPDTTVTLTLTPQN